MSSHSAAEVSAMLRRFAMERERYIKLLAKTAGMGRIEFDALDYIQEAGELTPNQLSRRLVITSGATTALIDRLEAAGRLTRSPNPQDRRSCVLRLTKTADEGGARQLAAYARDMDDAARKLSAKERLAVAQFLERAAAIAVMHADKSQARDSAT